MACQITVIRQELYKLQDDICELTCLQPSLSRYHGVHGRDDYFVVHDQIGEASILEDHHVHDCTEHSGDLDCSSQGRHQRV